MLYSSLLKTLTVTHESRPNLTKVGPTKVLLMFALIFKLLVVGLVFEKLPLMVKL